MDSSTRHLTPGMGLVLDVGPVPRGARLPPAVDREDHYHQTQRGTQHDPLPPRQMLAQLPRATVEPVGVAGNASVDRGTYAVANIDRVHPSSIAGQPGCDRLDTLTEMDPSEHAALHRRLARARRHLLASRVLLVLILAGIAAWALGAGRD